MLALVSSIPTSVREGFDVQDLPERASTLSEETLAKIFGGAACPAYSCSTNAQCKRILENDRCVRCEKSTRSCRNK